MVDIPKQSRRGKERKSIMDYAGTGTEPAPEEKDPHTSELEVRLSEGDLFEGLLRMAEMKL
jgi:hypothetical protein